MKVAICMRGAIGKVGTWGQRFSLKNSLYDNDREYVDYVKCYNSIHRHIITPNINDYEIDFFLQCWNTDLEDKLCQLYKPKKHSFENNQIYNTEIESLCREECDFGGISQALAIQKTIQLKESYEAENMFNYDIVIVYRYDVLIWKDLCLSTYEFNDHTIYVNGHPGCNADFHFIMKNNLSFYFKFLYNSIRHGNFHKTHSWISNYVVNYMKIDIKCDEIWAGKFQEVLRVIQEYSIDPGHLTIQQLESYNYIIPEKNDSPTLLRDSVDM